MKCTKLEIDKYKITNIAKFQGAITLTIIITFS